MESTLHCLDLAPSPAPVLLTRERAALEALLAASQGGHGQAVVVRGDPGLGKTTLLDQALQSASGVRVAMIGGVEAEQDLSFAALQRLCAPMMDRVDRLPGPQRDALAAAFGLRASAEIDPFLLGLAVLHLLAEASTDEPLACIVDDAHWLDHASMQVLAFVARRLRTESVALVFAVSEPTRELAGLPELTIDPLSDAEAHALLASVVPGPLGTRSRDRIVAESQGNPRALFALSRALTPEQFAGEFAVPAVGPLAERLRSQLAGLPLQTQGLLLLAAAEPEGDPTLLWRAAAQLRIEATAADDAETAGFLEFGMRVTFRDPRVRSAVYRGARSDHRRRVHRALADATEPETDPDRWAWHRANATLAPDADIADALARSASRAAERGGLAHAAAFLERSALLTPEPSQRSARALAAAHAKFEAGSLSVASELLTSADAGPLEELERAQLQRLRAKIARSQGLEREAPRLLLDAARALEPLDVRLARDTYLEALEATVSAGRLALDSSLWKAAEAARAARPSAAPSAADLLLDGLALLFTDGHASAASTLRRAVQAFSTSGAIRGRGLAGYAAAALWDAEATHALATSHVSLARDAGALTHLPVALNDLAALQVHAGDFAEAARLVEEADAIAKAIGHVRVTHGASVLAAWRGCESEAAELIEASRQDALARSDGRQLMDAEYAAAVLYNGLGRYEDALIAARPACEREEFFSCWLLPELIEAAARSGRRELALTACDQLARQTQIGNTEWALGIEARSVALVTEGPKAEKRYREAIERLARCPAAAHLARAHLVYAEWLRRQRRRVEAREQLRIAEEMFAGMGAAAFAARAHRELLATGEHARKRTVDTTSELTAQEAQIASLAGDGHSNPQIAARLFISARTVEYHLHKVFTKLGISSRIQLAEVFHVDTSNAVSD